MLCHLHTANTNFCSTLSVCIPLPQHLSVERKRTLLTHLARTFFLNALILKDKYVHFKHSKSMFICRANSYTYFASLCHVIKILRSLLLCLRFSCDDLTSNGCLNSDLKHLPGYGVFQALTHGFACAVGTVSAKQKTSIKYNG